MAEQTFATGWVLNTSLSAGKGRKIAQVTTKEKEKKVSLLGPNLTLSACLESVLAFIHPFFTSVSSSRSVTSIMETIFYEGFGAKCHFPLHSGHFMLNRN